MMHWANGIHGCLFPDTNRARLQHSSLHLNEVSKWNGNSFITVGGWRCIHYLKTTFRGNPVCSLACRLVLLEECWSRGHIIKQLYQLQLAEELLGLWADFSPCKSTKFPTRCLTECLRVIRCWGSLSADQTQPAVLPRNVLAGKFMWG